MSSFPTVARTRPAFVQRVKSRLEQQTIRDRKLELWIDLEDIPPSTEYMEQIRRGIEAANTFLFVISPASAHSTVCSEEVAHALANHMKIVSLLYQRVLGNSLSNLRIS